MGPTAYITHNRWSTYLSIIYSSTSSTSCVLIHSSIQLSFLFPSLPPFLPPSVPSFFCPSIHHLTFYSSFHPYEYTTSFLGSHLSSWKMWLERLEGSKFEKLWMACYTCPGSFCLFPGDRYVPSLRWWAHWGMVFCGITTPGPSTGLGTWFSPMLEWNGKYTMALPHQRKPAFA